MTAFRYPLPFLLLFLGIPQQAAAEATTMIVMDGSGSMWAQIDGRPKLEIARETVNTVLAGLPQDRVLGLLAYGHRERGNCADIELMIAPAANSAPAILDAVNTMRFQGKTPLTEAVRQAAAALRSTENPATVVLVTDGIETCEADPCALAAELESSGVDFTAHVIGFGLTREEGAEVACIAENTGGRYLPASDAGTLADALQQTVGNAPPPKAEAAPPPPPVERVRHYPGDVWMQDFSIDPTGRRFTPEGGSLADFDFPTDADAAACQAICQADGNCGSWRYEPPGSYFVEHARCFTYTAGTEFWPKLYPSHDGFVSGMKEGVIGLATPYIPVGAVVSADLRVQGAVQPGAEFTVLWSGPGGEGDWVDIAPRGHQDPSGEISLFYVTETIEQGDRPEGAGVLTAPAEPGVYDLRYVLGRDADRRVVYSTPITIGLNEADQQGIALATVQISVAPEHSNEAISWSATPLEPRPEAPEALAMPEAITGIWPAELYAGPWRVEGVAQSGLPFAADITVTGAPGQSFVIPVALETEGMGEDALTAAAAQGQPFTDSATGLSGQMPEGWRLTEAFFAETAAGVTDDVPTADFVGPDDRMLVLNPLQWLESNGTCYESAVGPLCVFGNEDDLTDRAINTLTPSLALKAAPTGGNASPFGGEAFKPKGSDPMDQIAPGWSAQ